MSSPEMVEALMQDPAFAELTDFTHQFEPFRAMGIHSKELVHSRILATFLNRAGLSQLGAGFSQSIRYGAAAAADATVLR